jgi:hypothetical protein
MFIVDIQESSIIDTSPFKVQRYAARRLNTKVSSGATKNYVERLERNISTHRLIEKLETLRTRGHNKQSTFQRELNKIDWQSKELMLNAEKKC